MERLSSDDGRTATLPLRTIVILYPVALATIAVVLNLIVWGVSPMAVSLPSHGGMAAAVITAVVLVVNHSWIMTKTELTRIDYNIAVTPEEAAGARALLEDRGSEATRALGRVHNTHRNSTENTVLFALLLPLFLVSSPTDMAVWVWCLSFGLGRLGHTYGYLTAHTGLRGIRAHLNQMESPQGDSLKM